MRHPHRWIWLAAFLTFALAAYGGLRSYVGLLLCQHGTCCRITPAVVDDMAPLVESGAIDCDKAAAAFGLPAWNGGPVLIVDSRTILTRKEYEAEVHYTLGWKLASTAADRWANDLANAAGLLGEFALATLVLSLILMVIGWFARPVRENSFP